QDHQTADEVARDVLQAKANAYTDRACEDRQRAQVNAGVFQNNENANNQHHIADDLGNGVLERTIESAVNEKAVEKKAFCPGGDPKHDDQERDKQKNLEDT